MTQYQLEELENIRRIAERGRDYSLMWDKSQLDLWQHVLEIYERIKKAQ